MHIQNVSLCECYLIKEWWSYKVHVANTCHTSFLLKKMRYNERAGREKRAKNEGTNDGTRRPDTRQSSFRFHPLGPYDGIYASFSPSKWNSRAGESLPGYGLLWTRATLLLFRSRLTHDSINSYASNTCIFLLWNLITLLEMVLVTIRWIGILLQFESHASRASWSPSGWKYFSEKFSDVWGVYEGGISCGNWSAWADGLRKRKWKSYFEFMLFLETRGLCLMLLMDLGIQIAYKNFK